VNKIASKCGGKMECSMHSDVPKVGPTEMGTNAKQKRDDPRICRKEQLLSSPRTNGLEWGKARAGGGAERERDAFCRVNY